MYWSKDEIEWMKQRGLADGQLELVDSRTTGLKSFIEPQGVKAEGSDLKPAKKLKPGLKKQLKKADDERRAEIFEKLTPTWVGDDESELPPETYGVEMIEEEGLTRYLKEAILEAARPDYFRNIDSGEPDEVPSYLNPDYLFGRGKAILKAGKFEAVETPEPAAKDLDYPHGPMPAAPRTFWKMISRGQKYKKLSLDAELAGCSEEPVWLSDESTDPFEKLMSEWEHQVNLKRRANLQAELDQIRLSMKPQQWRVLKGWALGESFKEIAKGEKKLTVNAAECMLRRIRKRIAVQAVSVETTVSN